MMRRRYYRILEFFARVILRIGWWDLILPRLGGARRSRATRADRYSRIANEFRTLAVQMGGVMIKVGQFLSARLDVLPREVTDVLAGLQDEVQPETFADIRQVIESEFHRPLEEMFPVFEPQPVASASIGQVHRAWLLGPMGDEQPPADGVMVKVQRPNIQVIVDTDLSALRVVGGWLNALPLINRRANVPALLEEFSRTLFEEVDYLHEGKNAETFAKNFAARSEVRVPGIRWSHSSRRVLTLEDVQAIKITDYHAIESAGIDRREVASRLFKTYLQQIFDDRFFHADPHPGNLFVLPLDPIPGAPKPWRLVFVDFGMAGEISVEMLSGLRELFIAVGTQDAGRIVRAYQMMGILLPGADIDLLEKASASVFQRFYGRSTAEILNMGLIEQKMELMQEFGQLLFELPFQIPQDFILLGRALAILSGMCTGLDPDFNIWTSLTPFAEQLITKEAGGTWKIVVGELTSNLTMLLSLPRKADSVLTRLEQGKLEVRVPDVNDRLKRLEQSTRRISLAIVFAALILVAAQLFLAGYVPLYGLIGFTALLLIIISIIL